MKLYTFLFAFLLLTAAFPQEQIKTTYYDLTIAAEQNPQLVYEARQLAEKLGLPHTIYTPDGVFIEARELKTEKFCMLLLTMLPML